MATIDQTLAQFLEALSSKAPAPGGGAAAALAGSLGASLVAMVCNLTIGKKGYEQVEERMRAALAEAARLRDELAALIDADIAAFNAVMAAYKLPKEEPEREDRIEEALREASAVPLQTAERCLAVLELAVEVAAQGNKNAVSDAGAAAWLASAGLEIALLNVAINEALLKDEAIKQELSRRRAELAREGAERRERALAEVQERLG